MIEPTLKIPIDIPLQVTRKNNLPCIVLRKDVTNQDVIKAVVHSALYMKPIIIQPKFTDNLAGVASLIEKGVLYIGKDGKYYFIF